MPRAYNPISVALIKKLVFFGIRTRADKKPACASPRARSVLARRSVRISCFVLAGLLLVTSRPGARQAVAGLAGDWQTWTASLLRGNPVPLKQPAGYSTLAGSRPTDPNANVIPFPPDAPPVFTDDPLVGGVTIVQALHINELRSAVNQVRAGAGMPAASWDEAITPNAQIKAAHILELRTRLNEARTSLGLPAAVYSDPPPSIGGSIRAAHVQELRDRIKETWATITAAASPATQSTDPRNALLLNGTSAYLSVPTSASLNITGPLTVEAWIKTNSISVQSIIERFKWLNTPDGGFALRLTSEGKLQFNIIRSNAEYDFVVGSTTVRTGVWHHVAGVFDGSELRLYIDGMLDGSKASTLSPAAGTANLRIGVAGSGDLYFFNGLIDEARLTSGVRYAANFTPDQRLSTGGAFKNIEGTNTRGLWNFDNQTANDSSTNSNLGSLVGNASFSSEIPHAPQYKNYALGTAAETQVNIDFDTLPSGTQITNQYSPALFSSDANNVTATFGVYYYNSSPPNSLSRVNLFNNTWNHFAPLVVEFTKPVNNLRFLTLASDDFNVIALMDIYQNNSFTTTANIFGNGRPYQPIPIDVGAAGYNNVTKIVIRNTTDRMGLAFDDFSFSYANATPTPTVSPTPPPCENAASSGNVSPENDPPPANAAASCPTPGPSPPPAPTGLVAVAGDEQASLKWNASPGAVSYKVKRLTATGFPITAGTFITDKTEYVLHNLSSNETHYIAVSAVNFYNQESANSNVVTVTPFHNCGSTTLEKPLAAAVSVFNWHMTAEVTERDGLVIHNLSLNSRYLAKMISVPYFNIVVRQQDGTIITRRGELTPSSNAQTMRTRLIGYNPNREWPRGARGASADYVVDRITETSQSCLVIRQMYIFYPQSLSEPCEPSSTLPCQRFYPLTIYEWKGRGGETLQSITIPQRLHFKVRNKPGNTVGFFRDCNEPPIMFTPGTPGIPFRFGCGGFEDSVIDKRAKAVRKEVWAPIVFNGASLGIWDNFHQTSHFEVSEPFPGEFPISFKLAGCEECIHSHWRWGNSVPNANYFGNGRLLNVREGSSQNVEIAVVRYREGEEHPDNFRALANGESTRKTVTFTLLSTPIPFEVPDDVVFWYASTGHQEWDGFFNHGAFAHPADPDQARNIQRGSTSAGTSSALVTEDGPTSVTFGYLYENGATTFTSFDAGIVGPLPPGYEVLSNNGYNITTEAVVSGPHTVSFNVSSVTDPTIFQELRVFHAEPDPFDPSKPIWVDRTIVAPDPLAPDFSTKTITAQVDWLGAFVLAQLVEPQPPNTSQADLAVTISDSPDPVVADNDLTYVVNVINNGPDPASRVGLTDTLSPDVNFVSAVSTQGSCQYQDGDVYCKLGTLTNGSAATITIVVKPTEGKLRFPAEGTLIDNTAFVGGNVEDTNLNNNSATESTRALPNPNAPPTISIKSPVNGSMFVGPANVDVTVEASDADGSVSQVEIYGDRELIGTATAMGSNQFHLVWSNVTFGSHVLSAVVTDNGGRKNSDAVSILVNGAATINITSPLPASLLNPSSDIAITAYATHPSGNISKVEFFADESLIALGTVTSANEYSFTWNNVASGRHTLTAVATDGSGITTTSAPVSITVTMPPTVSISSPSDGMSFPSSSNITITSNAQDDDSLLSKVDFYANGVLIGTDPNFGSNTFTFTWADVPDGIYSLTAVAVDKFGIATTSNVINVGVNRLTPASGEFVWFDDAVPAGAAAYVDSVRRDWYWIDSNPVSFLGSKAHQSKVAAGVHQHHFEAATDHLPVNAGERLYTYIFIDRDFLPKEIMLQWNDGVSWEHRAYWGANNINLGVNGTDSRRYLGPLPVSGRWIRLEVPVDLVGLAGRNVSGMAFTLDGGRATWDGVGKATQAAAQPSPGDFIWVDDAVPSGATTSNEDDEWIWRTDKNIYPVYSGQTAHETYFREDDDKRFRSHSFTNVPGQNRMLVRPADTLFTYVYLYPNYTPDEIMLEWNDGSGWDHRAYWGANFITDRGVTGTESRRYMGPLPQSGRWIRLEVPASYVGLEGKSVAGMAFSVYRNGKNPRIAWDYSGRSSMSLNLLPKLHATTPLYRLYGTDNNGYYFYSTNDIGRADQQVQKVECYIFPAQAAGTIALHRFRHKASRRYFYITDRNSPSPSDWDYEGVSGYVYPDGSTPGTVPLHRFRGVHDYFFATDRAEGDNRGYVYDGVACYVHDAQSYGAPNPIDDTAFFIRQHYYDFLNREPEPGGFNAWIDILNNCPPGSTACDRIEVSSAFFRSPEFYDRGYFIYRFYETALGRQPFYAEFMPGWLGVSGFLTTEQLEVNKQSFIANFLARPEFRSKYDHLSNPAYVDTLLATAGVTLSSRDALVNGLETGQKTRAQVLREIAESSEVGVKFYNKAFVVMQYFGYLRRDPDILYLEWIQTLNSTGNYRTMINGFINSIEYRQRFAP